MTPEQQSEQAAGRNRNTIRLRRVGVWTAILPHSPLQCKVKMVSCLREVHPNTGLTCPWTPFIAPVSRRVPVRVVREEV